jgi:hypothetical protein
LLLGSGETEEWAKKKATIVVQDEEAKEPLNQK